MDDERAPTAGCSRMRGGSATHVPCNGQQQIIFYITNSLIKMETNSLSIEKVFSAAWNRFGKNGIGLCVTYLCIGLCVVVVALIVALFTGIGAVMSLLTLLATHSNDFGAIAGSIGGAIAGIFAMFFFAALFVSFCDTAMMNLSLGLFSGRFKGCTFAASSLPASLYIKVVVLNIIVGFLCSISFILFIVPVFFVAPRLMMASRYQVDHPEAGIFESIGGAWNMSQGNTLMLLVLLIIECVCEWLLGYIPLIGSVVCAAFFLLVKTAAYLQMKGESTECAEAPAADPKLDTSGYSKDEH